MYLSNSDIQVTGLFPIATLNVLWRMMAGARYSPDDAELLILLEKLRSLFRSGNASGGITAVLPILMKIAPVFSGYAIMKATTSDIQEFFRVSVGKCWNYKFYCNFYFSHKRI